MVPRGPPDPPGQPAPRRSFWRAETALWWSGSLAPRGPPVRPGTQGPRDLKEQTENRVILVKMARQVLLDLQVFQEPLVILDLKERRETAEMPTLVQEVPRDCQALQDPGPDRPLWTWKAQGFQTWNLFGDCLDYLAPLGSLDLPGSLHLLSWEQLQAQGPSDPQEQMEHLVNLVCLESRVQMA